MNRGVECRRFAEILGWKEITELFYLQDLGVPDAVHGDIVWVPPQSYIRTNSERTWVRELDFDPWVDANDDLLVLEFYKGLSRSTWSDYKDCLYHETRGHGTHNVWEYQRGKFTNAAIMLLNMARYK